METNEGLYSENPQSEILEEKIEEIFVIERHFHHDDVESPHSIDELDNYDEHESYTSFVDEDDQFDDD